VHTEARHATSAGGTGSSKGARTAFSTPAAPHTHSLPSHVAGPVVKPAGADHALASLPAPS